MATQPQLSCQDADQIMRESREYFNPFVVKKMAINSIYYGRLEVREWPLNTLPEQTAFRLNRGWYNPNLPWKTVNSGRCEQDSCQSEFEMIARPGSESYTFRQVRKDMRTPFYCLTDMMYRLFPMEEVDHQWETNAGITKNVNEEFARSNWVGSSGHRWATIASDSSLISCEMIDDNMWFVKEYEGTDESSFNVQYVYVKIDPANIGSIGLLAMDNLDDALVNLQREDDAYRLDVSEYAGRPLLEIITPDPRIPRQMWQYSKQSGGWWESDAGFDDKMIQYALGIDRVIGNYAFCTDINGLRFDVDWTYNNGLPAFDEGDVDTWPRLVRVLPYYPVLSELGCKWDQNPRYNRADFGITTAWINNQMIKWMPPGFTGVGEAQGATQNFAGQWQWKNPDWECNIKRDQGFFWTQFRMAMQVQDPTMLHSFLHRLNNSRIIPGACCPLNSNYYNPTALDCFSCVGEPI